MKNWKIIFNKKYSAACTAFTLAEVLITLAIIGVVAAMTLPTLISKINDIANTNSAKVFNAKLIKGLNLTKTAGELNNTYSSTYDFLVNGLSKNLKMTKICDSDHIRDCIPYDKIKYEKGDTEDSINVADVKTASKLKLAAPFTDTAAFVMGDGTPVIVSYNKSCLVDADMADTTISACIAGLYDINGSRKPNKFGTKVQDGKTVYTGDLRAFNGAKIGNCAGIIGDICIANTAKGGSEAAWNEIVSELQELDPSYDMPKFTNQDGNESNDYWALAGDYCSKVQGGKLPTLIQLGQIADSLYYDSSDGDKTIGTGDVFGLTMKNKDAVYTALGLTDNPSYFYLWSSNPSPNNDPGRAYNRRYDTSYTQWWISNGRDYDACRVVCLGE